MSTERFCPVIPRGSDRNEVWSSVKFTGRACRISRPSSAGGSGQAASAAATSWSVTSPDMTSASPVKPQETGRAPETAPITWSTRTPAIFSAAWRAVRMARSHSSMSTISPRRTPRDWVTPTPMTRMAR